MRIHQSYESLITSGISAVHPVMTVGSFDGVHLGHQYLINELIEWAGRQAAPSLVMTFRLHPRTFMTGEEIKRITSVDQKLRLFSQLGVSDCLLVEFDAELKSTTARDFCQRYVRERIAARGLLLGHNNRIGRDREGTPQTLACYAQETGFELRLGEKVEIDGVALSSSLIREHIESGDFLWTRKMLGRPYTILGTVERGRQLGRTLGFPTINLPLLGLVHPPFGVYGVRVRLGNGDGTGEPLLGAANIGVRPTVDDSQKMPLLEVHLLDFDADCYGSVAEVEFLYRIREEVRFEGLEALKYQLARDVAEVRQRG